MQGELIDSASGKQSCRGDWAPNSLLAAPVCVKEEGNCIAMASHRPMVAVQGAAGETSSEQAHLPAVFTAPIRQDIVQQVHTGIAKNKRQPCAPLLRSL